MTTPHASGPRAPSGPTSGEAVPPAPGEDRSLALALVNTRRAARGELVDEIGDVDDARRWLAERAGASPHLRPGDVERVHALRAAVRELLRALVEDRAPDREALDALSAAAAAAPGSPSIGWRDGRLVQDWVAAGGDPLDRTLAAIAADAIALAGDERRDDLLACGAPGCVRMLLRDHNRRRWCSTQCGDRVRAARYHARHA